MQSQRALCIAQFKGQVLYMPMVPQAMCYDEYSKKSTIFILNKVSWPYNLIKSRL